MTVIAFDSKDFERRRLIQDIDTETKEPVLKEETTFFSPLGVGVKFKNVGTFKKIYLKRIQELVEEFQVSHKRVVYDSYSLKEELSHRKAIPFCDNLIYKLRHYIDSIFFAYVILPPDKFPTVEVGGFKSPSREIKSAVFLRNLAPMFSYITAWAYFGFHRYEKDELHLDSFNSKQTYAWADLTAIAKPTIFPHGDECNPHIAIADIIAYLTDAKLYNQKLKLQPEDLQRIWEQYGFQVETRYLDINTFSKYRWHSDDLIDITPYLARPIVFLLVDELEKLQPTSSPNQEESEEPKTSSPAVEDSSEEKRFRKLVRRMEPWYAATAYACNKGGAAQLFNYYIDRTKVKDGDTMVYIGNKSKEMAESFSHMLDIEVLSAKEVRKAVNREKA